MEPDILKKKMNTSRGIMITGGALLVLMQQTINYGYNDPLYIRTLLVVIGVGAIIYGFLRIVYFLIVNRNIKNSTIGLDSTKIPYQTMRLPYKAMLVILYVLVIASLLSMVILLISSYF